MHEDRQQADNNVSVSFLILYPMNGSEENEVSSTYQHGLETNTKNIYKDNVSFYINVLLSDINTRIKVK